MPFRSSIALLLPSLVLSAPIPARALEYVETEVEGVQRSFIGDVVIEAKDGGMMLKTPDGGLHLFEGHTIISRRHDDTPLEMFDRAGLTQYVLNELPSGFLVHDSPNYVIFYNTTRRYALWTSSLLEKLNKAFLAFWKRKGCEVAPPKQPLPVLVFADQDSYASYAADELGKATQSVIGYYSIASNRIMMYDLTGMQSLRREETQSGSRRDISVLLSLPAAEPLVATIVHEATHQIAFNCGLQTRYADNPIWMSEGLAVYFETPDLTSSRSWRGIGSVNYSRWDRFRDMEASGETFPLQEMVADDALFREPETAVDAYAQAWAWNYFLIQWHPEEYVSYLQAIAAKRVLVQDTPAQRASEFKKHFGNDVQALESDFYRRMSRIK